MHKLFAIALLVTGCSASPLGAGDPPVVIGLPVAPPDPMAIVWEQTYGMERATRPVVQWHGECRTEAKGGDRSISSFNGCVDAVVDATGTIELQSASRISDSSFAFALNEWKRFLTDSAFIPTNKAEVDDANRALVENGL